MARPRKSEGTRERLLDEGVAAFREHGYHGTGIKQVLDRVKVPKGSFYNYFDTKETFGAETIRHFSETLASQMSAAMAETPDPVSGLKRFFEILAESYEDAGYVGGCLIGNLGGELETSDVCRPSLGRAFATWRNSVREALLKAQAQGLVRMDLDAGEMADLLTEAWEGAVIRMKIDRSRAPLKRCLDRLLDDYFRP